MQPTMENLRIATATEKEIFEEMKKSLTDSIAKGKRAYKKTLKDWYGTAHFNINAEKNHALKDSPEIEGKLMASKRIVEIEHSLIDVFLGLGLSIEDCNNQLKKIEKILG